MNQLQLEVYGLVKLFGEVVVEVGNIFQNAFQPRMTRYSSVITMSSLTSLDGERDWLRDGDASRMWSWNA